VPGGAASESTRLLQPDEALAAALEDTDVGFFLTSADGQLIRVNRAFAELLSADGATLIGRRLSELFSEADCGAFEQALDNLTHDGRRRFSGEYRLQPLGGGDPVWVEVGVSIVARSDTGDTYLVGQTRDIRRRHAIEQSLRDSEALFRAAFEDAAVGMMLVQPDGTVDRANRAMCDLLGCPPDSLGGRTVQAFTHPDDLPATAKAFDDLRHDDALDHLSFEKRYLRSDGDTVPVHVAVAPVRNGDGRLRCFVTQVIDLTPLRAAEQKFRMVFDAAGIGISLGSNGMLTETNAAYQHLLGYSAQELSSKHFTEITHPDDLHVDDDLMHEIAAGRRHSFTVEKRYIRRDGETLWVRVTVTMAPDGSFGIGLIEDISERRHLLARTVEAAERERAHVAADLHDGPIQHLAATTLALDLLANRLARANLSEDDTAAAVRIRDDIADEITSLRQMMVDLRPPVIDERGLDAALTDAASALLADTPVDVAIESNLRGRRLRPELETVIYRITREALTNIRNHAHAAHATIALDAGQHTANLVIIDDGRGFDPTHPEGDRYGLVTMRERAEALGGTLVVTAGPGSGTRIDAMLPL